MLQICKNNLDVDFRKFKRIWNFLHIHSIAYKIGFAKFCIVIR